MSGYDHGHHGHSNESAVYDEKYSKEYTKNYNMERGIDYDLEAPRVNVTYPDDRLEDEAQGIIHEEDLKHRNPLFRFMNRAFEAGVEARGIERVPEDERSSQHSISMLLFWFSVNLVITTVPLGMLARPFFNLSFYTAICVIVCFTAIGACGTAFIATLGPLTGLRTMVICRYSMGFIGASIFSFLNILTHLGFSVTGVILGGQTLANVSDHKLPLQAAVVIVGVLILVISFFGYDVLHYWERYAWIVMLTFYICMYVLGSKEGYNPHNPLQDAQQATGAELAANVLSYAGIMLPSVCGWAAVAADFNSRLPEKTPWWKIFGLTWVGLMVPLMLVETLGVCLMSNEKYYAAYKAGDVSNVLHVVFSPWGAGGKFIEVVFSFSIASNCTANVYATSLAIQALAPPLQKVPRAVWVLVAFIIYTVAAIAGREHFSAILNNFLSILGYWVAFFLVVVMEEHLIFRKYVIPGGYDLTAYTDMKRLPVGIAGIVSCCIAAVMAVLSMSQTWYTGPIARQIGQGGDIGFEVSFATAGVLYPPLRYIEYRVFGR